jgi:serine/threonine protein kinase
MKVIKKEVIIKKGQFEHTKTEKMILEHVNHPFLVSLVYSFQDPTRLFFVMQFMSKTNLFIRLQPFKLISNINSTTTNLKRVESFSSTCASHASSKKKEQSFTPRSLLWVWDICTQK